MSKPSLPVHTAQLDWSEDGAPLSSQFDDVYFSSHSGIDESRYVFLEQNHLPARLQVLSASENPSLHLGETGFGTGLNFLCAWQLRDQAAPHCRLQFTSVEKYPLCADNLSKALHNWPELTTYSSRLIELYPCLTAGWHRLSFIAERVDLNLFIGDVLDGFSSQKGPIDAWFLDGFSPAKNPDMWSPDLFQQLARLGKKGTTVSTFTAASAVREGLKAVGFEVTRVKGHGRKRHMLTGCLSTHQRVANEKTTTPWFTLPALIPPATPNNKQQHAIVIGAGLAGTSTAFSLAQRGWKVSVFDRHSQPAQEASGNAQGILYTKLSAEADIKSDFYSRAYQYAAQQLPQLLSGSDAGEWSACGVLQLAYTDKEAARQQQFLNNCPTPASLVHAVNAAQASKIAGTHLQHGGLFFPQAGWAHPAALCRRYLEQSSITFNAGLNIEQLSYQDNEWQLINSQGDVIDSAPVVIIANAYDALRLDASAFLPVKRIRGQVTHIPAAEPSHLRTVICGKAYIAPVIKNQFHIGATFDLDSNTTALRSEDHQRNIDEINQLVPELAKQQQWQQLECQQLTGRVGFRCTSPDYLPLVGPLPDLQLFMTQYAHLRKDASFQFNTAGSYQPGLYLNIGHGSKGLVSCPLSAEILASIICDESLPIEKNLVDAVNPSRFIIRDLMRNKI
jgi:tRNA 5-methylaminomethyl-2-thiouridine biosynthesis bifunctional protein